MEVPNVVGLSQDEAQQRLDDAGLELGSKDEVPSSEFAEGAVIEQDPAAGTQAQRGTAVAVTVSAGPAQEPAPQASPTASATASATATATATASPAADAEAGKLREEQRKEAKKAAEERREERQKAAEERRKERGKKD